MKEEVQYNSRLSLHITTAMQRRLDQLALYRDVAKAEIVREALRTYLDDQEDIVGSRRYFTKAFQRRIDTLDWANVVLFKLLLRSLSILVSDSLGEPFEEKDLLDDALHRARREGEDLLSDFWWVQQPESKNDEPPA